MKHRLRIVVIWGGMCISACVILCLLFVFAAAWPNFWLVPVLGIGLPTLLTGLVLLGLIPGRRRVQVFVRLVPAGAPTFDQVEAVSLRSGLYRIISQNTKRRPWEFSKGDIVQCAEQVLPTGEKGLVAVLRV